MFHVVYESAGEFHDGHLFNYPRAKLIRRAREDRNSLCVISVVQVDLLLEGPLSVVKGTSLGVTPDVVIKINLYSGTIRRGYQHFHTSVP